MLEAIDPIPTKEYLKVVNNISTTDFSLSAIPFDEKIVILDHFVNLVNLNARTNFLFDRVG